MNRILKAAVLLPFVGPQQLVRLDVKRSQGSKGLGVGPILNFATPYGDYNATANAAVARHYRFPRTPDGIYGTTPANLVAHLTVLEGQGLAIVTVQQALTEMLPQL